MAEKLLEHAIDAEESLRGKIPVISAGVAAYAGESATPHSATALKKVGLSLDKHRSRPVNPELVENALLILCMTESHRYALLSQYDNIPAPVMLLRELIPDADREIPDPYGGILEHYEACRDSIVEAIPSIIRFLKKQPLS